MKKLSFSMLAMAGLLFVGCADKDVIAESGGQQEEIPAEGYVSLAINLPTTPSTRAFNDDFDDGDQDDLNEYGVNSCLLLFFEGTDEAGAEFICADAVEYSAVDDVDNDNITTSYKVVSKISGYDKTTGGSSKNLYALAALNYEGVIAYDGDDVTIGTTTVKKLSNLYTTIKDVDLTNVGPAGNKGFFMTNAVLSNKPGGAISPEGAKITQLATLDKTKICSTKEEARQKPAGEILVERAVAKATLRLPESGKVVPEFGEGLEITSADVSWTLDNLEQETYVARNKGTDDYITYRSAKETLTHPWRFVSHTSTKNATSLGTSEDCYRTYWCVDPNYDKSGEMYRYSQNPMNQGTDKYTSVGEKNPLYCYENTFDVPHQRYKNTTRAIIKVKVNGGNDFYTFNDDKSLYTEEAILSKAKNEAIERMKNVITPTDLQDGKTFNYADVEFECTLSVTAKDKSCTINKLVIKNANDIFTAETFKDPVDVKEKVQTVLDETLAYTQANYFVYKYDNGVMYYEARFTHFGDELTPWNNGEYSSDETDKPTAGDVNHAYPGCKDESDENKLRAANNYLGRYGMVRNNWYDVEITAFRNFGSPVEPGGEISSDETPDDSLDEYIAVRIHVLAWAKRTQSWGF